MAGCIPKAAPTCPAHARNAAAQWSGFRPKTPLPRPPNAHVKTLKAAASSPQTHLVVSVPVPQGCPIIGAIKGVHRAGRGSEHGLFEFEIAIGAHRNHPAAACAEQRGRRGAGRSEGKSTGREQESEGKGGGGSTPHEPTHAPPPLQPLTPKYTPPGARTCMPAPLLPPASCGGHTAAWCHPG